MIYYYDTASALSDYAIWCIAGYSDPSVGVGDLAGEFFVDNRIYVITRDDGDLCQCLWVVGAINIDQTVNIEATSIDFNINFKLFCTFLSIRNDF